MPTVDTIKRQELQRLQREQVLRGVARAVADKGYSAVTISDIAAAAHASRTTVYAHFSDKEDALLALHQATSERISAALEATRRRPAANGDWSVHLHALVESYLEALASASPGERASLLEVASTGPDGRRARRKRLEQLAARMQEISSELAQLAPDDVQPLSAPLALGVVAALYELVQRAADDGPEAVRGLTPIVVELITRLVRPA